VWQILAKLCVGASIVSLLSGCLHRRPTPRPEPLVAYPVPPQVLLKDIEALVDTETVQVQRPPLEAPRTPSRPEAAGLWEITLEECVRQALLQSQVVRATVGNVVRSTGSTRYDQAIVETQVDVAQAVFDPQLLLDLFWTKNDQPTGVTFGPGIPIPTERDQANFTATLSKRFVTGGTAALSYNTGYLFFPRGSFPGSINPQYRTAFELSFQQPLLRGGGVEFHRAPLVIARIQSDQTFWQWKESVLALVRSVEEAYWGLYAAHVALRAVEEVLPLAAEVVRVEQARLETQQAIPADVAQAEAQLALFRQQRTRALANVLAQEAQLRNLLGLPPNDRRRLVPAETPPAAPLQIDWNAALEAALRHRPQLARQRLAVRVRQLQLTLARNALQPQLDVRALWRINGIGNELDEALELLGENRFNDWELGATLGLPVGFRQASADLRAAQLQLQREVALLNEAVHETTHELADLVREAETTYAEYLSAFERQQAAARWVEGARARFETPVPIEGQRDAFLLALQVYLQALQTWADAMAQAASFLARYHMILARIEEAKGTLLELNHIRVAAQPDLPSGPEFTFPPLTERLPDHP
jgi:outer membrane protein TolC